MATAGIIETLRKQPPERLRESERRIREKKLLTIYTHGKTGTGKSSLVKDLLGPKATHVPATLGYWDLIELQPKL